VSHRSTHDVPRSVPDADVFLSEVGDDRPAAHDPAQHGEPFEVFFPTEGEDTRNEVVGFARLSLADTSEPDHHGLLQTSAASNTVIDAVQSQRALAMLRGAVLLIVGVIAGLSMGFYARPAAPPPIDSARIAAVAPLASSAHPELVHAGASARTATTHDVARARYLEPVDAERAARSDSDSTFDANITEHAAERLAIRRVLDRFEQSQEQLDAGALSELWPSADAAAIEAELSALSAQDLIFRRCELSVQTDEGAAFCQGTVRTVRVGDRVARTRPASWMFRFVRQGDGWTIAHVALR
jgi:hypothetical protein